MNATAPTTSTENITPAVHLEFIQNLLDSPESSTAGEVENYHRALFLHHHAVEWEAHRQRARQHEETVSFLAARLKDAEQRLGKRTKFVPVNVDGREDIHPAAPWNAWDLAMFAAGCLGILGLITFGILNVSFNLLESGFVTFRDHPFRSYLWAALLPVGALAVKVGWDFLQDRKWRDAYLWTCLTLGLAGVLVWVAAYACVYPTLSKGINEQIAGLTVFDNGSPGSPALSGLNFAGARWVDVVTVAGQAIAEIFLSAVLGMHLTVLYGRHRPVRLAQDPVFAQLVQEREELREAIERERASLGEAAGHVLRLENQLTALVAYGRVMFHREAARRQDPSQRRQVILDQLSDHLRNHLQDQVPGDPIGETISPGRARNGG